MDSKPFWKSKTFWVNAIMLVAAVVDGTYGATGIPDSIKVYIALAINVALRFLSAQSVTLTGAKDVSLSIKREW